MGINKDNITIDLLTDICLSVKTTECYDTVESISQDLLQYIQISPYFKLNEDICGYSFSKNELEICGKKWNK